jgi:hypothetical protein
MKSAQKPRRLDRHDPEATAVNVSELLALQPLPPVCDELAHVVALLGAE